jgi:hypothetical protein
LRGSAEAANACSIRRGAPEPQHNRAELPVGFGECGLLLSTLRQPLHRVSVFARHWGGTVAPGYGGAGWRGGDRWGVVPFAPLNPAQGCCLEIRRVPRRMWGGSPIGGVPGGSKLRHRRRCGRMVFASLTLHLFLPSGIGAVGWRTRPSGGRGWPDAVSKSISGWGNQTVGVSRLHSAPTARWWVWMRSVSRMP